MRFEHFTEIDSTSAELRRRANAGDIQPVWIQADRQTDGVGRRGRRWTSQTGNLFCSGLFPLDGDLETAALLTYAAALAVADTCCAYVDPDIVQIKWPNDVLLDGAKTAGLLLESGRSPLGPWMTLGVGINLTSHPSDTPYPATNLSAHIDSIDPEDIPNPMAVMAVLSSRFDHWRDMYNAKGFEPIKAAWTQRARGIGEPITANLMDRQIKGTMLGLSDKGELSVRLGSGAVTTLSTGDVFFR